MAIGAPACMVTCMYSHTYSKNMDQPGKVANPARGQLNREHKYFPVRARAWEFGLARRVHQSRPASACSSSPYYSGWIGACLRDSSRVPRRRPFIYLKPPYAIGLVSSLSSQALAYQWLSLPRVRRRHKVSKPQGRSFRVLPWQVTMDQLTCASLSHTHYGYEVGMLKYRQDDWTILCTVYTFRIMIQYQQHCYEDPRIQ